MALDSVLLKLSSERTIPAMIPARSPEIRILITKFSTARPRRPAIFLLFRRSSRGDLFELRAFGTY